GYGIEGGGIIRSNDSGKTWLSLNGLPIEGVLDIEEVKGMIYSSMVSDYNWVGVWESPDNGDIWVRSWGGSVESTANTCLTSIDSLVFVGTYGGGIYSTKLLQNVWTSQSEGLPNKPIIHSLLTLNKTIYAAVQYKLNDIYKYSVYYSNNLGENWIKINKEFSSFALFRDIMETDGENIFLLTTNGIEMLNVSDNTWKNIQYNLPYDISNSIAISGDTILVGTYSKGLWQIPREKIKKITSVQSSVILTADYKLNQNYPNPFNPNTQIEFYIPKRIRVTIEVYNILGEKITTLINTELILGNHKIEFDGSHFNSGIYFYKLISDEYSETKKMLLIK
ncbi:MAG: T9SS type A sorting domain-containing protein, partial [Melioribacteraceae bacterium]